MFDADRLHLTRILETQLHDYWYDVDFNWGRTAHLYYTQDGVFEASSGSLYEGREVIKSFYQYRLDRGARTAVHSVSNFRAFRTGATTATSTWYMQLFACDGTPPHQSAPPILLSAMEDKHLQQPDGTWLCQHRLFKTLFKGGVPTTRLPGVPMKGPE